MVEHRLAKARVASSNLVFRFKGKGTHLFSRKGDTPLSDRIVSGGQRNVPVLGQFSEGQRNVPNIRGCSSMVEPQPSKLVARVRFPSPAP